MHLFRRGTPKTGTTSKLRVGLRFDGETLPTGTLSLVPGEFHDIARFQYDPAFLRRRIEISPLRLPLRPEPTLCDSDVTPFHGLPGVFADSLPDRWGEDLLKEAILDPDGGSRRMSELDRLRIVGDDGMGALVYERIDAAGPDPMPDIRAPDTAAPIDTDDIDRLAGLAAGVEKRASYSGFKKQPEDAMELLRLSGSVGGAMPKILIGMNDAGEMVGNAKRLPPGFEPWILKLQIRSPDIDADACAIEQAYAIMARRCGLAMPPTRLIPSKNGSGHFAVKRFDRTADGRRLHMHTAAGLMHQRIGLWRMDYAELIELTRRLTENECDMERMYRLAVFNVLACNRDDHGKNFGFLMDRDGTWSLSPAYDLTFRQGMRDRQCTKVMGEGEGPTNKALFRLAETAGVPAAQAKEILNRTRSVLAGFKTIAQQCGVRRGRIEYIARKMKEADRGGGFIRWMRILGRTGNC